MARQSLDGTEKLRNRRQYLSSMPITDQDLKDIGIALGHLRRKWPSTPQSGMFSLKALRGCPAVQEIADWLAWAAIGDGR